MTDQDLEQIRKLIREEISTGAGQIMEVTAHNLTDLREELSNRIGSLERRFDILQQRFDVQSPVILSLDARLAGFTRSVDQILSSHGAMNGTLAGMQRAIEELNARVRKLEAQQPPPSQ